jgi:hypothetical protein
VTVRAVVVLAVAVSLGLAGPLAAPAHAHGRGSDATDFRSEIVAAPAAEGLRWRVYGGDELLWLRNDGPHEVVVLGYDGEPYLRFADGVWENRNSPATYLNDDRYAQVTLPAGADPDAAPDWRRVSSGSSHAWHDHRIHWMSPAMPPSITDPDVETVVSEYSPWRVPVQVDGADGEVVGELRWVPGPAPWPWLAASLPLVLLALAGLRTSPVGRSPGQAPPRWPGLARPAALVLGVVVLLNGTHLVDDLFAVPMPASVVALAAVQTTLFMAIGAFGAIRAWQSGDGAFTALGVGAGAVLIGQGLLYLPVLTASQLETVFPDWLARLTVATSLTQALAIGAVAVLGTRRLLPAVAADAPESAASTGS